MPSRRPAAALPLIPAMLFVATLFALVASPASANTPPATPVISEPATDNQVVNAADVHMQTNPFMDVDAGDHHLCSDWEIVIASSSVRVWSAHCVMGVLAVHIHLGDGAFEGPYASQHQLAYDTTYRVRARHRDSSGDAATEWSAWGERLFVTGPATSVFPLRMQDVPASSPPDWLDAADAPIVLPSAATKPALRIQSASGAPFVEIRANDGTTNTIVDSPPLATDAAVRLVLDAGSAPTVTLPESTVAFVDNAGFDRTLYLPALSLSAGSPVYLWVAADGGTYFGTAAQTTPDFSSLARGAGVPWVVRQPGFAVEIVASGFQLPSSIAFVPQPGSQPTDPFYYVSELYGSIKVVRRNGAISNYATGLLNFDPFGQFPGAGEQGIGSIVIDPTTGDLFASLIYDAGGPHYPKVIRLHSTDGGFTASQITTVLDLAGEPQGPSHQISNLSIGPDGKLYVHVGDGFDYTTAQNPNSFRGKILRVNLNGTPATDNPFYNASDGINAMDYIVALGFRNPFGGAWSAADGNHYTVENGPSVDRFSRLVPGRNYGWNNTDQSMQTFALYNWTPSVAPVNIAFVQAATFGSSGFPAAKLGHAFVTESGPTYASGPATNGKRVSEFAFDATGTLTAAAVPLIEYGGTGKATAVGLAAGPDGLYFTDLYKDRDFTSAIDVGANVLRIKYVGNADFAADAVFGTAPLTVHFVDTSVVPSPTAWQWNFGDGTTDTGRTVTHVYDHDGVYDVTLRVTGANGVRVVRKAAYVCVGPTCSAGLNAEYFDDIALTTPALTRKDATIDFEWGTGSPDPLIGPETFSVRWTGQVTAPTTGTYTFTTRTDDGVRLWIDGKLLVDRWIDQGPTEWSGTVALTADDAVDVRMEYYENTVGATAQLFWSGPSVPKEIVPADRLSPPLSVPAPPRCDAAPADDCAVPQIGRKSSLLIKNAADDAKDRIIWRWLGGPATTVDDFATPLATASYSLCIYDGAGALVTSTGVRAGGLCGTRRQKACWRETARGFEFRDTGAQRDGVTRVSLLSGAASKSRIFVNAAGVGADLPSLPLTTPVRVQLKRTGGQCWEAKYSTTVRDDVQQLKARAD